MESPRLPWEVIERIICHSWDHPRTLRSFSLTCRQLRPHSRCVMLARVDLQSSDHVFAFVDFLQVNPHLKPLIHSIVARPGSFAPFPLLHILSDLSEIEFTSQNTISSLHQSSLTCFQRFGAHIQTLHLFNLSFSTSLAFAQLLLAFSSIAHLVCTDVGIKAEGNQAPLAVAKRRLSEKLRLKSLVIDSESLTGGDGRVASVGEVLLDPNSMLAPSTVESLKLIDVPESHLSLDLRLAEWSRLESLALHFAYDHELIANVVDLLENVDGTTLKDVMLQLDPVSSIADITRDLSLGRSGSEPQIYTELEHALLKFPRVGITWIMKQPLRADRNSFWTRELEKNLPVLSQRGAALMLKSETVFSAGHDDSIWALVVSQDSKWVASASNDSTIVLWDTRDGSVAWQCAFPDYQPARSLAFSPDSRYLVCGGEDGKAVIWDLGEGARIVATLEGHTRTVSGCAWSPDGTIIATASFDATVRLWDARTFQQLHVLKEGPTDFRFNHHVAFSPDGRWLASGCSSESDCYIWAIPRGTLHKTIQQDSPDYLGARPIMAVAAVFDPGSTRIATTPGHDEVEVREVETGGRSFVSGHVGQINAVSFSPDGKLVLAAVEDSTVKVWDVNTGVKLLELEGHRKEVRDAYFSPCGKYIASGAEDCTVRLWRVSNGSCVGEFSEHEQWVRYVGFSPDGKTLSSGAIDGTIVVRQMHDIIPIDEQGL